MHTICVRIYACANCVAVYPPTCRPNVMATVDQFDFKKLVLKRTPRVVDKRESTENNFWRRFQVRTLPECDRKS